MFSPTFSKSTSFHAESGHSQIRRRKISYFANRHAEKKNQLSCHCKNSQNMKI